MERYDVVIIGAGVIGCALAKELKSEPWMESLAVAVLEKNSGSGLETSSKASGVLHSGLHHHPASLKARLARQGSHLAYQFAKDHSVPMLDLPENRGMLIAIATEDVRKSLWKEAASLWHLWRRGKAQGINFSFLTQSGIQKLEPNIRASAGIFIPEVRVVDSWQFVTALEVCAKLYRHTDFFFSNEVTAISIKNGRYLVTTKNFTLSTRILINAAGLYADDIANMALEEKRYTQYPWRGEYYEIVNPKKRHLARRLVYPAVPSNSPGKGIHFSPRPNGQMLLGPNAILVKDKNDYENNKTPASVFLETANKFLHPEYQLEESDLSWSYSGIRPKLSDAPREDDFVIAVDHEDPILVNCIAIESPGLSAAMGIARHIRNLKSVYRVLKIKKIPLS